MLIILPELGAQSKRQHPPFVLVAIMLMMAFAFLVLQFDDANYRQQAKAFYFSSKLDQVENPLYIAFLISKKAPIPHAQDSNALYELQKRDPLFQKALKTGAILSEQDLAYWQWIKNRRDYDYLRSKNMVEQFGFKTAEPTWISAFSNLFLQSSWPSFLGNFFTLLLVGLGIEMLLGSVLFCLSFFSMGLGAMAIHLFFHPMSLAPIVGASGAVAGLVGIFSSYYGMQSCTYLLLPVLKTIRAPGLLALVLWGTWAVVSYQYFPDKNSSIELITGGFSMGFLIGFLARLGEYWMSKRRKIKNESNLAHDYQSRLNQAAVYMNDFNFPESKRVLFQLHQDYPTSLEVLFQLFNAAKSDPTSEDYHRIVSEIVSLKDSTRATTSMINVVFKHYLKMAEPTIRYDPNIFLRLSRRFRKYGYLEDAEKILRVLIKFHKEQSLKEVLAREQLLLAKSYFTKKDDVKGQRLLEWLLIIFPETESARQAQSLKIALFA